MTKRERNLVFLMLFVAVIGSGMYIVPMFISKNQLPVRSAALTDIESQTKIIVTRLNQLQLTPEEKRVLEAAATPWTRDPFFTPEEFTGPNGDTFGTGNFVYSGFLETPSGNYAIINGMDYGVGDLLDGGGFEITTITPDFVTLQSQNGSTILQIPYNDDGTM
ncbi:hypothetical protein [Desulfovibrio inopinatus]|uniref:hypothetical protein n=1 Tax=Desulfovibrio inopinatus TaxID=102109 RepID=UPI000400C5E3|nr:hypothetical protein [Desulfovibrio inopinatus]